MRRILLLLAIIVSFFATASAQTYNKTVAQDGSGDYTTVAAALKAVPDNNSSPYYIYVKSGVYHEKDTLSALKTNVVLIGQNVLNTIIYNNDNANTPSGGGTLGTAGSATFFVNATNFSAFNITFQNNSGIAAGQSVAVEVTVDKASFRDCRFLGFQDVLYLKNANTNSYFKNCYIEGTVDFIFGASTSWFDSCYIYCKYRSSNVNTIVAPNTSNTSGSTPFAAPWGFVLNGCSINGAANMATYYYLGRPWQNNPQSVFIGCNMSNVINTLGWASASAGTATIATSYFGEYNSTGAGANPSGRLSGTYQLTSGQAANYTLSNIFTTPSAWDPTTISNQTTTIGAPSDIPMATANFTGTQVSGSKATFTWNTCWPLAIQYQLMVSNNGGSFTAVSGSSFTGTSANFNYSDSDVAMPTGVNRYILVMTNGSTTITSTDTITISNQPTISTTGSFSAFSETSGGTTVPSVGQSITLVGTNLTNDIVVNATSSFQVSKDNSNWSSSVTYTQVSGAVASTSLYVRMNNNTNGTYSGTVALTTTGGTTVNIAVTGTTSSAPQYVANTLIWWPLDINNVDSSAVRSTGVSATTPSLNRLYLSNGTTLATAPAYSPTYGECFGASTNGDGTWTLVGGTLQRSYYQQFTITPTSNYSLRVDSILLNSAFYNTSSNTKLAVVYSKNGFTSPADSTDITSGGTLNGTTLTGTAYGAFASPIALANLTSGNTNSYRLPINGSTGVNIASNQTLTIRLYFACSSTGTPKYGELKNVQIKGTATPNNTAPTFVTTSPTLSVCQNAAATDVTSLLHVNDADAGQTETFSTTSGPSHGTLTYSSYTVSSGSTNITPAAGSITYTPATGYTGSDAFTIQVSDGTSTASQVVNVTVNALPATPGVPTSNSPHCSNVTLTKNGTVPTGETWYWQAFSTGTDNANSSASPIVENTSGTYYINSQNNTTGCWSAAASVTVTVNALPTVTFITHPLNATIGVSTTYKTQSGMSSYVWTPAGSNYTIVSGGTSTDSTITIKWTATGSQSISVNYNNAAGCSATSATSVTTNVTGLATPPEPTAAVGATVDNSFSLSFTDDATWRAAITLVKYGSDTLVSGTDYSISAGSISITPGSAIKTSGTQNLIIYATGYINDSVSQTIAAGAATHLVVSTQPAAPATNGAVLATQPIVYIEDQYNNLTSNANVTAAVASGSWTIGGTLTVAASNGTATFTNLTAASYAAVTGATITFTSGSINATSSAFNIAVPAPPAISTTTASVDNNFNVTFTDNPTWRAAITSISGLRDTSLPVNIVLPTAAYDATVAGQITFKPSQTTYLQLSGTTARPNDTIIIYATGYANDTLIQTMTYGAKNKITVKTQVAAPTINGGLFATQPAVRVSDQYGNTVASSSGDSITVNVGSPGGWILAGTITKKTSSGAITWSDLTATTTNPSGITGATIYFTSRGLTPTLVQLTMAPFNLPVPSPAVTYYWAGGSTTVKNWNSTDAVWARTLGGTPVTAFTPLATDVFVFDGSNVGAGATGPVTLTSSVASITIGQIVLKNNANVTITENTSARTYNLAGGVGVDLDIQAGSKLTLTGSSSTTFNLLTGSTGSISGILQLGAGVNSHLVNAADYQALTVNNGGQVICNAINSSYPFGTGTNGSVVFASGSKLTNANSADPFGGLTRSIITLQPNSTFEVFNTTGVGYLDGHTFSNVLVTDTGNVTQAVSSLGFTCDSLTVTATAGKALTLVETGTIHIKSSLTVNSGSLSFNPASAATVSFDGTGSQNIYNAGTLTFGTNETVSINNAVALASNLNIGGTLNIASSNTLSIGANTLNLYGTITGAGYLKGSSSSNLSLNNTAATTVKFNPVANDSLLNTLTINGTGTVNLGNGVGITKLLSLKSASGSLNTTGGHLTLKSTSITNTAELDTVAAGFVITGSNVTVERYIPVGLWEYNDLGTSGVLPATGTYIFDQWQEGGAHSNYGIYITGNAGNNTTNASRGFDVAYNANNASMWTYTSNTWSAISNTYTTPLYATQGYRTFVRGDRNFTLYVIPYKSSGGNPTNTYSPATIRTTGYLATGNIRYTTSATTVNYGTVYAVNEPGITGGTYNWNLIANPYACPISWSKILSHNVGSNLSYTFYYLTKTSGGSNTYVTVNPNGVVAGSNVSGSHPELLNIQAGQAFWVYNTGANPVLTISEKDKYVGGSHTSVFGAKSNNMITVSLLANDIALDGTVAVFDNNYTSAIGEKDSRKLKNAGENIFINIANTDLSIAGLPVPTVKDVIALNLSNVKANTEYTMTVDASQFAAGVQAYIKDATTNKEVLATEGIKFTPTADAASYTNRFSLVFKAATTPITVISNNVKGSLSVYPNPVTEKTFTLQTLNVAKGKYNVTVIDNLGKEVMSTVMNHEAATLNENIKMNNNLTSGMYRIVVKNAVTGVVYESTIITK